MRDSQRLLRAIRSKRRRTVGTRLALSDTGSLVKGAVVFFGTKKCLRDFTNSYKIDLTIPPPHVRSAPPFTQGRLKLRSHANS